MPTEALKPTNDLSTGFFVLDFTLSKMVVCVIVHKLHDYIAHITNRAGHKKYQYFRERYIRDKRSQNAQADAR